MGEWERAQALRKCFAALSALKQEEKHKALVALGRMADLVEPEPAAATAKEKS